MRVLLIPMGDLTPFEWREQREGVDGVGKEREEREETVVGM